MKLLNFLLIAIMITIIACQQPSEADVTPVAAEEAPTTPDMEAIKAEIQALETAYAEAHTAKNSAAVAAFYSEDAVKMSNNKPSVVGREAIIKDLEESYAKRKGNTTISFETTEVFGDDNLVTEVGKSIGKDEAGKVTYTGKYMAIWEKRDGKWICIRDIGNDDAIEK